MVIAITGIISAVVAVFIQKPIQGYFDTARRAELTDIADTAVRRFSRDVHLALPNSVRITNGGQTIEFLLTSAGGRYRAVPDVTAGAELDFTQNDTSFEVLGPTITFAPTSAPAGQGETQNQIVIYNLGIPGADAYAGDNRRSYVGGIPPNIQISSAVPFPFDSPSHTFQVVDTPVTYQCDLTAGILTLTRYSGYAINAAPLAANGALLAKNVSVCQFAYTPGVTERSGLVTMRLSISQESETVTLYHEVHVSNVP